MHLSQQVSVSELANTKDLLQRQNCRNAVIQRMFLESFDCCSWSNWPCAAKIQNNVRRVVGRVQWDCCHACSVFRAIPCSISSCGWIRGIINKTGIPIVWFQGMTISFFTRCFWGWKFWLRTGTFLAFSFLILASSFVRGESIACTVPFSGW